MGRGAMTLHVLRLQVQKTLLNCLLSTVHALRAGPREATTLTEQIVQFNEVPPPAPAGEDGRQGAPPLSFTETLQIQLIRSGPHRPATGLVVHTTRRWRGEYVLLVFMCIVWTVVSCFSCYRWNAGGIFDARFTKFGILPKVG